jgi:hypothetical protein
MRSTYFSCLIATRIPGSQVVHHPEFSVLVFSHFDGRLNKTPQKLEDECKDRWSRIFRVFVEPGNARMLKNVPSGAYPAGIYLSPGGCQKTKLYQLGSSSGRFNFKRASRNCLAGELLKLAQKNRFQRFARSDRPTNGACFHGNPS